MRVIVDTTIWSLALRRKSPDTRIASELASLLRGGHAIMLGVIRQEVLSGVPDRRLFQSLKQQLRTLRDYAVTTEHHERAAEIYSLCRSRGVQGSFVDFLICAVAEVDGHVVYSTDADYERYAGIVPFRVHRPNV